MADAPSSGGSNWEPFEIIVVVLLIGGVLMRLDGSATTHTTTSTGATTISTPHQTCGLTTTRPNAQENVSSYVAIAGSVSGCNWIPTDTVALYAQVIDASGTPVSEYTPIHPGAHHGTAVSFTSKVFFLHAVPKGTGYLILTPAIVPASGQTVTARIPLTFTGY